MDHIEELNKARNIHESIVIEKFKEDFESCRKTLEIEIEEYNLSEEKDIIFILLNLKRIIEARGFEVFETLNLDKSQISNAIKNKENYDRDIINKMFEALGIKERI
jgi:hypothetical protein